MKNQKKYVLQFLKCTFSICATERNTFKCTFKLCMEQTVMSHLKYLSKLVCEKNRLQTFQKDTLSKEYLKTHLVIIFNFK